MISPLSTLAKREDEQEVNRPGLNVRISESWSVPMAGLRPVRPSQDQNARTLSDLLKIETHWPARKRRFEAREGHL
jgi:hypothetical protein